MADVSWLLLVVMTLNYLNFVQAVNLILVKKKKPKQLLASIWGDWEVIVVSGSSTGIRSINYIALTYKIKADPSSILLEQGDWLEST